MIGQMMTMIKIRKTKNKNKMQIKAQNQKIVAKIV